MGNIVHFSYVTLLNVNSSKYRDLKNRCILIRKKIKMLIITTLIFHCFKGLTSQTDKRSRYIK